MAFGQKNKLPFNCIKQELCIDSIVESKIDYTILL